MCDACHRSHLTKGQSRALRLSAALRTSGKADGKKLAWEALDAIKQQRAKEVQSAAQSVIDDLLADAVRQVNSAKSVKRDTPDEPIAVDLSFDMAAWILAMEGALTPALIDAIMAGLEAGALSASYSTTFDADSDYVQRILADTLSRQVGVTQTAVDAMQRSVTQGLASNETLTQITSRVRQSVATLNQSETVAQTATTAAFESSQLEAFEQADVDTKMWLTQRDGNSRAHHADADGQEVAIDEAFTVDGENLMHPGDGENGASAGNIIRCRCSMIPGLTRGKRAPQRRAKTWRLERDEAIKARYKEMREANWESGMAISEIMDEYAISARTVERALGWG